MPKYVVSLARCVVQTTTVEVEAKNEEEAATLALTDKLPDNSSWSGSFDSENYAPHAVHVAENSAKDKEYDGSKDKRYAILLADISYGDGTLIPQPWMNDISDLMMGDISADWEEQVGTLSEDNLGAFYEWLSEQGSSAKIIPFPLQRKPTPSPDE